MIFIRMGALMLICFYHGSIFGEYFFHTVN